MSPPVTANRLFKAGLSGLVLAAMLVGLPLLGVAASGGDIAAYLEFPPVTQSVQHPEFSWPVFIALSILIAIAVTPFLARAGRAVSGHAGGVQADTRRRPFPWWGWLGAAWGISAWMLAWTRLEWMMPLQLYTFPAIWLGYIVVVNALTYRRSGRCMLLNLPRTFLLLFPVSAVFWWFFEYLNRFVQNWYYVVPTDLSAVEYTLIASLCFSTVLPAVLGTAEWLKTFRVFGESFANWFPLRVQRRALVCTFVFVASGVGLVAIGLWPTELYPFLWVAPLLLITSWQGLLGKRNIFSSVAEGDWTHVVAAALAGVICGFCWEMWNYYSWAKWVYTVPYVQHPSLLLFEMPIVGYSGYLTFGLECLLAGSLMYLVSGKPATSF